MTRASAPRLVVHDALGQRTVAIDHTPFTIGRAAGADLQLATTEVSRDHAEIVARAGGHLLRDRQSRFGTFVNGTRITEQVLAHGDRIECGGNSAVVVYLVHPPEAVDDDGTGAAGELRQVAVLLEALRGMGAERVLDEVLVLVLDAAIQTAGAERGFIMLPDASGGLDMKLARAAGGVTLAAAGFATSRKIPEEVFATGRAMVVADLLEGDMAAVHDATVAVGIRHVLCVPLRLVRYVERPDSEFRARSIGVLYLDSREKGRLASAMARTALETLATEAATAIENARLYREALEKARLDEELRTASRIQQALLPEPRRSGAFFEAMGASLASRAIGGDFYDYLDMPDGRLGFALGDVTGKGPPAALLTAVVQGILAAQASQGGGPAELVRLVNRVLLSRHLESRFVTIFLGALGPDGRLTYCNAAQNPPLLFTASGWRRLETGGTLIGAFEEAVYEEETIQLGPGDTLVLYSDGVVEAPNAAGEEFGEDRVRALVEAARGQSVDAVMAALLDAVQAFTRGDRQFDDITAVVLRYGGP